MKIAGRFWTAAKFIPSWHAAVLVAPSPTQVRATRASPRLRKAMAAPVTMHTLVPIWLIGWIIPFSRFPICRSLPPLGESDVATYPRNISAKDIPIMWSAPALRIIGLTTSISVSRALTAPTVTASSPVPSQAFEIMPVLTQRLSPISWSRVRSRSR